MMLKHFVHLKILSWSCPSEVATRSQSMATWTTTDSSWASSTGDVGWFPPTSCRRPLSAMMKSWRAPVLSPLPGQARVSVICLGTLTSRRTK